MCSVYAVNGWVWFFPYAQDSLKHLFSWVKTEESQLPGAARQVLQSGSLLRGKSQLQMLAGCWQETPITLRRQGGGEGRVPSGGVSVSALAHLVNALLEVKYCSIAQPSKTLVA